MFPDHPGYEINTSYTYHYYYTFNTISNQYWYAEVRRRDTTCTLDQML